MLKKLLAYLLVVSMLLAFAPMAALAEEPEGTIELVSEEPDITDEQVSEDPEITRTHTTYLRRTQTWKSSRRPKD